MAWSIVGNDNPEAGEVTFVCDEPNSPLQKIVFTNYRHMRPAFIFSFLSEENAKGFGEQVGGSHYWTVPGNGILVDSKRYSPSAEDDSDDEDAEDFLSVLWDASPSLANNGQLKSKLINLVNAPYSAEDKSDETIYAQWDKLIQEGNYEYCYYLVTHLQGMLGAFLEERANQTEDLAKKAELETEALKAYLLTDFGPDDILDKAKAFIFKQYREGKCTTEDLVRYKEKRCRDNRDLDDYRWRYEVAETLATQDVNAALTMLKNIPPYGELAKEDKKFASWSMTEQQFQDEYEQIYQQAQQLISSIVYFTPKIPKVAPAIQEAESLDESEVSEVQSQDFDAYVLSLDSALKSKNNELVRTLYTAQIDKYDDPESEQLNALRQRREGGMLESLDNPCENYTLKALLELTTKTIEFRKMIAAQEREVKALKAELQALRQPSAAAAAPSRSRSGSFFSPASEDATPANSPKSREPGSHY